MEYLDKKDAIYGYKAFNKGLINKYEETFEVGKVYIDKNIDKEYGYHFCKNLEDIFIFFKDSQNVEVCEVLGYGRTISYYNDYYGLYDVYATEIIEIIKKIDRSEIINYFLSEHFLTNDRITRFISLFKLNDEEIELFKFRFKENYSILDYISYYQEGNLEAFKLRRNVDSFQKIRKKNI